MPNRLSSVLAAETLGTFLFFFVGMGAVILGGHLQGADTGGVLGVALAHGLALAVLVSALGAVSGGHFNPAVTFGVWLTGRIEPVRAGLYVLAQLAGAVLAALALRAVFNEASWRPVELGTPFLDPAIGVTGGRTTDSMVAPMRVAVAGASPWTTSSKRTAFPALRMMIRGAVVPDKVWPSSLASMSSASWKVPM